MSLIFFVVSSLLVSSSLGMAMTPAEISNRAAKEFSKLSRPSASSNAFEKWVYNTALLTVGHCWRSLNSGSPVPDALNQELVSSGSWRMPSDKKNMKICRSIADQGLSPHCSGAFFWAKGVSRREDLPRGYLQLSRVEPIEIEGVLTCYLNSDRLDSQPYSFSYLQGGVAAVWKTAPRLQMIQLRAGPQKLESGVLKVTIPHVIGVDGGQYSAIVRAVIVSD